MIIKTLIKISFVLFIACLLFWLVYFIGLDSEPNEPNETKIHGKPGWYGEPNLSQDMRFNCYCGQKVWINSMCIYPIDRDYPLNSEPYLYKCPKCGRIWILNKSMIWWLDTTSPGLLNRARTDENLKKALLIVNPNIKCFHELLETDYSVTPGENKCIKCGKVYSDGDGRLLRVDPNKVKE